MMSSTTSGSAVAATTEPAHGLRVNGKNWKEPKKAFRKNPGLTSYEKRMEESKKQQAAKAKIKEMKDEKEAVRQGRIQAIKAKREAKAEKERYEVMAAKMHQKRVDRIKRREKRNKLLAS